MADCGGAGADALGAGDGLRPASAKVGATPPDRMPDRTFLLTYKQQRWRVVIELAGAAESRIGLLLDVDGEWVRYGVVQLQREPHSCTVATERNIMPYAIMRALLQIVEHEARRLGIVFDLAMTAR